MAGTNTMTLNQKRLCVIDESQSVEGTYDAVISIGQQIKISPQILDALASNRYNAIHFDLLVLCAAVEFADRAWGRPVTWSRSFHLTLPVRQLSVWQDQNTVQQLQEVLRHLTCDIWEFEFVQVNGDGLTGQKKIPFPGNKTFAIAYSEGLDSRAVSALSGPSDEALRIRVTKTFNKSKEGEDLFSQLPFEVLETGNRESSCRIRGFQFAAITSIAAHVANFSRIVVPESGQGALSPVMVRLWHVYPDFRNYPTFFRQMEAFIHRLLGHDIVFEQRQLWSTKGQTLKAFLALDGKRPEDLIETRSCWRKRDVVNLPGGDWQCGICAACILRRFSLYSAGIEEPKDKYVIEDLSCSSDAKAMKRVKPAKRIELMRAYGIAGVRHFDNFAKLRYKDNKSLRIHSVELARALGLSETEILKNIRDLCSVHADEWQTFIAAQGKQSFLQGWIKGGN